MMIQNWSASFCCLSLESLLLHGHFIMAFLIPVGEEFKLILLVGEEKQQGSPFWQRMDLRTQNCMTVQVFTLVHISIMKCNLTPVSKWVVKPQFRRLRKWYCWTAVRWRPLLSACLFWYKRSVCHALGRCRRNIVSTINGVFPSSLSMIRVPFLPEGVVLGF